MAAIRDDKIIRSILSGRRGRIALAYVEWAGEHVRNTVVDWTLIDSPGTAGNFADKLSRAPLRVELWTSISSAIDYALEMFAASPHRGKRRVIDISGDGPNNDGGLVIQAHDRAVQKGVIINGLPIINGRASRYGFKPMPHLDNFYQDCVIGGFGAFIIVANTYNDFARVIRRKLILEIAGHVQEPQNPRVILAATDIHPSCDIGEIIRDSRESF